MEDTLVIVVAPDVPETEVIRSALAEEPGVAAPPAPHVLTALAFLGPYRKVDHAPYDHILAAQAQRVFISKLPDGGASYWQACRAYAVNLYERHREAAGARVFVDVTPGYAAMLPFIERVLPEARYIIAPRHPLAAFSACAGPAARRELARGLRYMALRLAAQRGQTLHVPLEDFELKPRTTQDRLISYVTGASRGLPRTIEPPPMYAWTHAFAQDAARCADAARWVLQLDERELQALGYPPETVWAPLAGGSPLSQPAIRLRELRRESLRKLWRLAAPGRILRPGLEKARLALDVLLRE